MEKVKTGNKKHSGYVALIGRTNVGKSTFLNNIMEVKVSIVSNKPQTTRKQILGIKTTKKGQIVFFDSPGIHRPHFKLNEKMMQDVQASLMEADIILYFIDIGDRKEDEFALSLLKGLNKTTFLVINKIDKFSKTKILEKINYFKDMHPWQEIVPISALKGTSLDLLEELIYKYLPGGEGFYPADEYTLQTKKFYVSELIREKVLHHADAELPFTTTVKVEEMTDRGTVMYIRAEIYVEKRSQKKILVGKQGNFVKTIGKLARVELEDYFEKKVYLDLFVKIVPNWRNSASILSQLEG
ncbi:MAG: GTPase Era [Candidatus Aminicenantes bacterium]|nr:MAG: GTPase Era [Candidatus Aminicenantes bacterium]